MTLTPSSTTAQLRGDVDRGRAGDKVPAIDPAAAPLGTDDEAAGTPVPSSAIAQSIEDQRRIGKRAGDESPQRPLVPPTTSLAMSIVVVIFTAAILLALVV